MTDEEFRNLVRRQTDLESKVFQLTNRLDVLIKEVDKLKESNSCCRGDN